MNIKKLLGIERDPKTVEVSEHDLYKFAFIDFPDNFFGNPIGGLHVITNEWQQLAHFGNWVSGSMSDGRSIHIIEFVSATKISRNPNGLPTPRPFMAALMIKPDNLFDSEYIVLHTMGDQNYILRQIDANKKSWNAGPGCEPNIQTFADYLNSPRMNASDAMLDRMEKRHQERLRNNQSHLDED